jgi:maleamate amidohydrolase
MDIRDNYAQGGFFFRLPLGVNPALIIVDFVEAYVRPGSLLYADCDPAHRAAVRLLKAAREARIPIIHTRVAYQRGGRDGGVFFRKVPALKIFEDGADPELQKFAAGLEPVDGETVITKQYASAFFGTALGAMLTALGIDTLLIAGVSTSGCIRATAVDSCQHGFVPVVISDAVGDRARAPHEAALFDMQAKYSEVLELSAVLAYLDTQRANRAGKP